MDKNEIRMRFIKIFENLGLKQAEVAAKMGIGQSLLSKVVNFQRKADSIFFYKLIKIFDININWLLTGQGSMFLGHLNETNENDDDDDNDGTLNTHVQKVNVIEKYCKLRENGYLTEEQLKIALDDLLEAETVSKGRICKKSI